MIIVDFLIDIIGYTTARFLLPFLSLGMLSVERVRNAETGFNWLGFKRRADGRYLCASDQAGFIGLGLWGVVVVIVSIVW